MTAPTDKALEAAARAVAKAHGCDKGTFTVCWGELERGEVCVCKRDARAAITAYLEAMDEEVVHDAVRKGVCATCGTPAVGYSEGATACDCRNPSWRPTTTLEQARAAIAALKPTGPKTEP